MRLVCHLLSASVFAALVAAPGLSHAQALNPRTAVQAGNAVENEVANLVKRVRAAQDRFRATNGRYASAEELGVSFPETLKDWGTLHVDIVNDGSYVASFLYSRLARMRGITSDDVIVSPLEVRGAPRFQSLSDAREEIRTLLVSLNERQKQLVRTQGRPAMSLQDLISSPLGSALLRTGQIRMEVSTARVLDPASGRRLWMWTLSFTPAEIARETTPMMEMNLGNQVSFMGYVEGSALRFAPGPRACLNPLRVNLPGVTNHVYTIDQSNKYDVTAPVPLCSI